MWRSAVDKIRGERQDGCSHDQRLEKTQRSTSDCFPKHQQERAHWQRAPPAGKTQTVFLKMCQTVAVVY